MQVGPVIGVFIASGITDTKQKRGVLLHLAGPEVQDVFATLQDTGEDYATALEVNGLLRTQNERVIREAHFPIRRSNAQ